MHSLLKRQIKRHFGENYSVPPEWQSFLETVSGAYKEFDTDRGMLERSLELSSQELLQANSDLRALFQAIPDMLFRLQSDGTIIDFKAGATVDLLLPARNLTGKRIQDVPVKSVAEQFERAIQQVRGERNIVSLEYALPIQGQELFYEARWVPLPEDQIVVIVRNITERRKAEALRIGQSYVLEMIASGTALPQTLDNLLRLIESQVDGMFCSILLLDPDGNRLRHGAAPTLPASYNRAVDGIQIGPKAGSCGTAAYRKEPVIVSDIQADPLWEQGRETAAQHGLRACWSVPILSHQGAVLGTFAMYYRETRTPTPVERRLISIATQIAGIALERKRAEEELQHTVSLLQSTLESTADGVLVVDNSMRIVLCNERFAALWRVPHQIIESRDDERLLAHAIEQVKNPDAFLRKIRELYANPDAESSDVIEFLDGRIFERYSCPQRLDGLPVGRVWSFRDVTERARAEDELFHSQRMLRTVLDTIPQRVFWKNRDSVYVGCNQALAEDCGYHDPGELIGKTDYETTSANTADLYRADDRQVMETGWPKVNYEEPQVRPDGTRGWLRTSKVPLRDKDGAVIGVLGTYDDITERKRLEEQFRQSQKMEAFGQLAAGVAHDFNNILTIIHGNLSLLRMGAVPEAERPWAINQAIHAAERAANLTRQLLTFSRRQLMQPRHLDLNEVLANMTRMLQRLIGEHIALEAHYAPAGAPVNADPGMMEQVLVNLAVNSRDAMPKGGRLILETKLVSIAEADTLTRPEARAGDFIQLSVVDTGSGIAPEHLPHIFEPFFTTKEVGKGTGLGLATVFGIVDQHQGWIEVETDQSRGTTMRIFLPRLVPQPRIGTTDSPATAVRGGNEAILLVEDEPGVRELMRALLTSKGYTVHQAPSGPYALQLWEKYRNDIRLLITDMVMPEGINGRKLADLLLSERPDLKVIYCSGYTDDVLGEDSPLRNNRNFLEKPFDPDRFLERVRHCLDERQESQRPNVPSIRRSKG